MSCLAGEPKMKVMLSPIGALRAVRWFVALCYLTSSIAWGGIRPSYDALVLPSPPDCTSSSPVTINEHGDVLITGWSKSLQRLFLYHDLGFIDIGMVPGSEIMNATGLDD